MAWRWPAGKAKNAWLLGAKIVSVRVVTSNSLTRLVVIKAEFSVSSPLIVEIVRKTLAVPGGTVMTLVAVGLSVAVRLLVAVGVALPVIVTLFVPVALVVLVSVGVAGATAVPVTTGVGTSTVVLGAGAAPVTPFVAVVPAVPVTLVVFVTGVVAAGALGVRVGVGVGFWFGRLSVQAVKSKVRVSEMAMVRKTFFIRLPLQCVT